jgi:hypothetical protein
MTCKAKIFLTAFVLCSVIYQVYSQAKSNGYKLKANFTIGQSGHPNTPVQFPIWYTDASITPDHQQSRLGYQISIAGLRELNDVVSIGLTANISKFGFIETGDELSFWSNAIHRYSIQREFKMYGVGITSGISILQNVVNTLSSFIGIEYQEFTSTEGVYLWREVITNQNLPQAFQLNMAIVCRQICI